MSTWRWLVGGVLAVAVAATTWTPPTAPAAVPVAAEVDAPAADRPQVAMPWQPGRPQLGINVYWENNPADSDVVVRAKARRLMDQVVGMEANAVALSFPFFTDSLTASRVYGDQRTPSPERVAIVMDEARRSGLRTALRPLLDQKNLEGANLEGWRGLLAPADRAAWYASYEAFLAPYLEVAERDRLDGFGIAAELNAMQADPQWPGLVRWARGLYRGELTYAANWDVYPQAVTAVPTDEVTIDAYPMLDLHPWSSEQEMTDAWAGWLEKTAPESGDLVLSEMGGPAESNLPYNPANTHTEGAELDEGIQERWFAAGCRAARDRGLGGLYWWKFDLYVDPALADPAVDTHDTFLGRPAEQAARQCFSLWNNPS